MGEHWRAERSSLRNLLQERMRTDDIGDGHKTYTSDSSIVVLDSFKYHKMVSLKVNPTPNIFLLLCFIIIP